jgi:hypothetical protein
VRAAWVFKRLRRPRTCEALLDRGVQGELQGDSDRERRGNLRDGREGGRETCETRAALRLENLDTLSCNEAAVGKTSEKEITYLMTRRLSREQAVSLIIRGFMDVAIMGLPTPLSEQVNRIVDTVGKAG